MQNMIFRTFNILVKEVVTWVTWPVSRFWDTLYYWNE